MLAGARSTGLDRGAACDRTRLKSVQCSSPAGLHRIAYKEWGDPANPRVLVCVHGVTRVADDFDALARALCDSYRVVCPDVVGRGRSDRLRDPAHYVVPQYVADMVTLIARVTADSDQMDPGVDWFGTSMGGLIGMVLASLRGQPGPQAGAQRYRPDAGPGGDGAHRRLHRPGLALPELRGRRRLRARGLELLRPAQRGRMGQAGPRRAGPGARRPVGAPLRPGPGQALRRHHAGTRGRRTRPRCGPPTTRSAARRCWCAASSPTCCRARRPRR